MKKIFIILFLTISLKSFGQSLSYDTSFTGSVGSAWNAMVDLPSDYYTSNKLYTCFIYLPGNGETAQSGGVTLMDNNGFHYWIRTQGWNGDVVLGNGTHEAIFISLQLPIPNTNPVTSGNNYLLKPKLDAILARYRIAPGRMHLMNISGGSGTGQRFITYKPTVEDDSYALYFKSVVSIQSRIYTSNEGANLPYPNRFGHAAKLGLRALAFYQHLDGSDPDATWTKNMRDSVANSATHIKTDFNGGGHCCFNEFFNPSANNWTTSNTNVMTVTGPAIAGMNIYQWAMRTTDSSFLTTGETPPVVMNAGTDFEKAYNQDNNTPSFQLAGSVTSGSPSAYVWSQVSGPNTATITNGTTLTPTISNITKGEYVFRITADGEYTDEVLVRIVDYNEKGSWPCRSGGGRKFTIGGQLITGVVTTTYINLPYINRPPYLAFGEQILGGDTIQIRQNPNNSNSWNTIVMGYFGGSAGCPVVVMPYDTNAVKYGGSSNQGYFRLSASATGDSNWTNNVKFWGDAHRQGSKYVYGFQYYSADKTGFSLIAHGARNLEVRGLYSNGGMVMLKKDSDSSKPWSIYNNYNPGPHIFKNVTIVNSGGESFYQGTTDADGGSFDGPTHRGASGSIYDSVIVANAWWDGIQVANMGDSVILRNIVGYNNGLEGMSSQQSISQIGGYNTNALVEKSVFVKGTGGFNFFGGSKGWIKHSIFDSLHNFTAPVDYSTIYATNALSDTEPPPYPDSLELFVDSNILAHNDLYAINFANTNGRMKDGGGIRGNVFVDASRSVSALINANNVVVPQSGNSVVTSLDIDGTTLASSLPAWKIYKILRNNPTAMISFFEEEADPPNVPPVVNAGVNITVYIPETATVLTGEGTDADGAVTTYAWTRISGPNTPTIVSSSSSSTVVTGLVEGTYVFRLTVTDNDGGTSYDEVEVVVAIPSNIKTRLDLKKRIEN